MASNKLLVVLVVVLIAGAATVSTAARQAKDATPTDRSPDGTLERSRSPRQRIEAHLALTGHSPASVLIDAARLELPEIGDFLDHATALVEDGRSVRKVLLLGSTGEAVSSLDVQRMHWERQRA